MQSICCAIASACASLKHALSSQAGAAYVFVDLNGDGDWTDATQQAYVKASNPDIIDMFGASVAILGSAVVVAAPLEDGDGSSEAVNSAEAAGAAYVFVDPDGNGDWTDAAQQAYLKAFNADMLDQLGSAVCVSGDVVIVGALAEQSDGSSDQDNSLAIAGAAYVFEAP